MAAQACFRRYALARMEGKAPAVEDYGLTRMMACCNKDCRPVRRYPVALGQMPASKEFAGRGRLYQFFSSFEYLDGQRRVLAIDG